MCLLLLIKLEMKGINPNLKMHVRCTRAMLLRANERACDIRVAETSSRINGEQVQEGSHARQVVLEFASNRQS